MAKFEIIGRVSRPSAWIVTITTELSREDDAYAPDWFPPDAMLTP